MECFVDAHYFPLPTQGNIYSVINLLLSSGRNKILVATLKRKVYSCEFIEEHNILSPVVKEVPFTYIPSGAEIISIDAFNRSKTFDDFFIGITIIKSAGTDTAVSTWEDHCKTAPVVHSTGCINIGYTVKCSILRKVNADQSTETYLNIYTEQEVEDKAELNLDCLAQNCFMLELPFIPYQLYHTILFGIETFEETVWLLSGSDLKMHLFREDPQNHTYCEIEAEDIFPEFSRLPSIVFWVDINHTNDKERRLTAFGCECGLVKIFMVDIRRNILLLNLSNQFDAPVSRVSLFKVRNSPVQLNSSVFGTSIKKCDKSIQDGAFNLLVVNTLQPSVIFMDVINQKFDDKLVLPDSDKYDIAVCACIADIDMNTKMEILIGTFSKELLVYKYENDIWALHSQHKFSHSVHSINYIDITGDGVKELIVVTMLGVQIFQHNLLAVMNKFKDSLQHITINEARR